MSTDSPNNPTRLGGFELLEKIGEGGMGAVYRARQTSLERLVALKVLSARLANDEKYLDSFRREARSAAKLSHPNIIPVYDAGEADGSFYYAMEFVNGETLAKWVRRDGALPETTALEIGLCVATALKYAWDREHLIHRDIKPENIIIDTEGNVKICDLGLAKNFGENTLLSLSGQALGTPNYMSPEQARASKDVDFRTDIYSLGLTLYFALTGQVPFQAGTATLVMARRLTERLPDPRKIRSDVSVHVIRVLEKMLAVEPSNRYASWDEVIRDMTLALQGRAPLCPLFLQGVSSLQRQGLVSTETTGIGEPPAVEPPAAMGEPDQFVETAASTNFGETARESFQPAAAQDTGGAPHSGAARRRSKLLVPLGILAFVLLLGLGGGIGFWLSSRSPKPLPQEPTPAPKEPVVQTPVPRPDRQTTNFTTPSNDSIEATRLLQEAAEMTPTTPESEAAYVAKLQFIINRFPHSAQASEAQLRLSALEATKSQQALERERQENARREELAKQEAARLERAEAARVEAAQAFTGFSSKFLEALARRDYDGAVALCEAAKDTPALALLAERVDACKAAALQVKQFWNDFGRDVGKLKGREIGVQRVKGKLVDVAKDELVVEISANASVGVSIRSLTTQEMLDLAKLIYPANDRHALVKLAWFQFSESRNPQPHLESARKAGANTSADQQLMALLLEGPTEIEAGRQLEKLRELTRERKWVEAASHFALIQQRFGDTRALKAAEAELKELMFTVNAAVAELMGMIHPPRMSQERIVVEVPGTIEDAVAGGGGRYLILYLKKQRQVAIFDVNVARIVKYLNIPSDSMLIAAGREKLIVVLADQGVIQRWNLRTFEREASVPMPLKGTAQTVALGSASNGPFLLTTTEETRFFDLQTLNVVEVAAQGGRSIDWRHYSGVRVRASADNSTFGAWRMGVSPSGVYSISLRGTTLLTQYEHSSWGHVVPSADGRMILTGQGLYTADLKPIPGTAHANAMLIPDQQGIYFLGVRPQATGDDKDKIHVFSANDKKLLLTVTADMPLANLPRWGRELLTADKRLWLVPAAELLVTIPETNDKLIVRRFDILKSLAQSDVNYLFVSSVPRRHVNRGEHYSYQIQAQSNRGGIRFNLDSAPQGMTLTKDGLLQWTVPKTFEPPSTNVVVSLRDAAGNESLHAFEIQLR